MAGKLDIRGKTDVIPGISISKLPKITNFVDQCNHYIIPQNFLLHVFPLSWHFFFFVNDKLQRKVPTHRHFLWCLLILRD